MHIFLGEDTYAAFTAAKEAAVNAASKLSREVLVVDADLQENSAIIFQNLEGNSLFGGSAVLVAKRLFHNKALTEQLAKNWEMLKGTELYVWHEGKLEKQNALYKKALESKLVTNFGNQEPGKVGIWLADLAKTQNLNLSPGIRQYLLEQADGDKWRLVQEVNKLANYADATGGVDMEVASSLVGSAVRGDIWKLLDNLGNSSVCLAEFEKLNKYEDMTQYVITMLGRELGLMAQVQSASDPFGLGLHKFVVQKTLRKVQKYSWSKVQKLSKALLRLDLAIKEGKVDPYMGLVLYLLSW